MAIELSEKAKLLSQKTNIERQLILEIDGFEEVFGAIQITKGVRFGDKGIFFGKDGLVFGGVTADENSRPWISMDKSTNRISQQLNIDDGGSGSIQSMTISLVDKAGQLTEWFSPGNRVPDMLGRKASIFLSFAGASHPEDSIRIFNGYINKLSFGQGNVKVMINHPESLKDSDIFIEANTELASNISSSDITIPVVDARDLLRPRNNCRTFVKIDDEVIEYQSVNTSTNEISVCTRAQFGTIAEAHSSDADVVSMFEIEGNAIDVALQLLMSTKDKENDYWYKQSKSVASFNFVSSVDKVTNAIFFQTANIQDEMGLVVGDWVRVDNAKSIFNTFGGEGAPPAKKILSFGKNALGSWVVVENPGSFVDEVSSTGIAYFASQFNTLPDGCGLTGFEVDVAEHLKIKQLFFSSIPEYRFVFSETMNAKDFIAKEIFKPAGLYQVPRKGRISIGKTAPPVAERETKTLDYTNIIKAENISIERSISKNFYNSVIFKFDKDEIEDKYKKGHVVYSATSQNKIPVGNKPLVIEAAGLRKSPTIRGILENQGRRYLERYQEAAEGLKVDVNYKTGFNIDISDTVILDGRALKISDIKEQSRGLTPRIFQVINKDMSIKGDAISLTLLDTAFVTDARYGTIAPSSKILSGSTSQRLTLQGFTNDSSESEKTKWSNYLGEKVRVRNQDFSVDAIATISHFDNVNPRYVYLKEALPFTPDETFILDTPPYDDSSRKKMEVYKSLHAFFCPRASVISGISNTELEVSALDIDKFFVGSYVLIHNNDYSIQKETTVKEIVNENLILSENIGFTPDNTFAIDLVGFQDKGLPYRLL